MKRLPRTDFLLICVLVPLWTVAFALHVHQIGTGRLAWVGVFVSPPATADAFPVVRGFWPGLSPHDIGLAVGDELVRVGDVTLRGAGPFGFVGRVYEEAGPDLHVRIAYARGASTGEVSLALLPVAFPWRSVVPTVSFVIISVLVLLRLPGIAIGRAFFLAALAYSFHWTFFFGGSRTLTYVWAATFFVSSLVMLPLALRTLLLLSEEVGSGSHRRPHWPWLFALFGPVSTSWVFGVPFPPLVGFRVAFLINATFITTALVILTRAFVRAGPLGRRQLKWVLWGFYVGTVPVLATDALATLAPAWWWLHEIAVTAEILIPICVFIAIVRYNFFDVDRLISSTASYTVLFVILAGSMLTMAPSLTALLSSAARVDPQAGQLVLSFAIAAGLVRAERYLRPLAERIFFPERRNLQLGFERLLDMLSTCTRPDEVFSIAGTQLEEVLRPECCRIYAATDAGYVLTFSRGLRQPSGSMGSIEMYGQRHGEASPRSATGIDPPVEFFRMGDKPVTMTADLIGDFPMPRRVRSTLESLGLAVVVPVFQETVPAALICLGSKRSGDVYTSTDLALLAGVADKLASVLLRFDQAEIVRQERSLQQALRRYVPDPVVGLLASGREIEGGERRVSILFVDLRSFTAFSETHEIETVVDITNRYTEAVSGVIRDHSGTVVEFLGDGVMAVFGSPEPVANHALAAVKAACNIVSLVRRLRLGESDGHEPIGVSAGIATGKTFVGNVRSADRLIYTAVGDTANLAARLENLTRRLGAAIAIDAPTHDAAREAACHFQRKGPMLVKGRRRAVDVYFLPQEWEGH